MILKQFLKKLLFFTLLVTISISVHAKNYEKIIEELSAGTFPKNDIVGNMIDFRSFHNDFLIKYSAHCQTNIANRESRVISMKEETISNGIRSEEQLGTPTIVTIEKKYVEKFDDYFNMNFQTEKNKMSRALLLKGHDAVNIYAKHVQYKNSTLEDLLADGCNDEKLNRVYVNMYRKSHKLEPIEFIHDSLKPRKMECKSAENLAFNKHNILAYLGYTASRHLFKDKKTDYYLASYNKRASYGDSNPLIPRTVFVAIHEATDDEVFLDIEVLNVTGGKGVKYSTSMINDFKINLSPCLDVTAPDAKYLSVEKRINHYTKNKHLNKLVETSSLYGNSYVAPIISTFFRKRKNSDWKPWYEPREFTYFSEDMGNAEGATLNDALAIRKKMSCETIKKDKIHACSKIDPASNLNERVKCFGDADKLYHKCNSEKI